MRSWAAAAFLFLIIILTGARCFGAEPNVEIASTWWPELTNVVTPIGWRDHPHRFAVLYNGTIIALPYPERLLRFEWEKGLPLEGVQLDFDPSPPDDAPSEPAEPYQISLPGGRRVGDQGWSDHATPVLWTRRRTNDGITLRQSVFAHMEGGGVARSGTEPMFCWIRLEVTERAATSTAKKCALLVEISSPHIRFSSNEPDNCRVLPQSAVYPTALSDQRSGQDPFLSIVQSDAKVRLAITATESSYRLTPPAVNRRSYNLRLEMDAEIGAHLDLLLPMAPADAKTIDRETKLGYSGALDEADRYWANRPATAASIHTPEPLINATILRIPQLAMSISTTVPETRHRSLLTGPMVYSFLWVTSTSRVENWLLDPLGWHDEVAKDVEIFRQDQGRAKPPGDEFPPHRGYFGVPEELNSGNQWLTDHGAVLYTIARHGLLTDDQPFIDSWTEPMLRGCEFIRDARRLPRRAPAAAGVMPPASASDLSAPIQAFWSDAWNYKGLTTAVRLLQRIKHPRAAEFEREAADYRDAIISALRAKAARQPRWTDAQGRSRPLTPMTLTTDDRDALGAKHEFYLDTGPMSAVWAGLLPADDPLMSAAVDYFREGPQTRPDAGPEWHHAARLVHEMSSSIPSYSWNTFMSQALGDRAHYLEGMYSLFTGSISRQTFVSCETRGGITENILSGALGMCLLRLAVVDDAVESDRLHLLRLTPLAWISSKDQTRFENMPTEFGPVSLRWKLSGDGRTLAIDYAPRFRHPPESVTFHVPPVPGLQTVTVNQQPHDAGEGAFIYDAN